MTPYYEDAAVRLFAGDCLDVLRELPDSSVDAVITDPPAAISFMQRSWDGARGGRAAWVAWLAEIMAEALRVTKPGGHALVWALPRTSHWTACAIEDAGWEIRDRIIHLFGTGYPKSLDVGKALDKRGGAPHLSEDIATAIRQARERRGWSKARADDHFCGGTSNWRWYEGRDGVCRPPTTEDFARIAAEWPELARWADAVAAAPREREAPQRRARPSDAVSPSGFGADGWAPQVRKPATSAAAAWRGWGTALKPAAEDWWLARKPLDGTVAANVLAHRTGALNIDASRVPGDVPATTRGANQFGLINDDGWVPSQTGQAVQPHAGGRWPSNVTLTHSIGCIERCEPDCPVRMLDEQSGPTVSRVGSPRGTPSGDGWGMTATGAEYEDEGSASRFFPVFRWQAKAPTSERPRVREVMPDEEGGRVLAHPT